MEKESEMEQAVTLQSTLSNRELELKGVCIRKMRVSSLSSGLGGRSLMKLERQDGAELPPHRMTPGDIVGIRPTKSRPGAVQASGVVYRVEHSRITISFDDFQDDTMNDWDNYTFAIDKLANDVTYRKMREAVDRLSTISSVSPCSRVIDIIFNGDEPTHNETVAPAIIPITKLNFPQIESIQFALASNEIALIHGPPGTGKTTTVVEFIVQVCKSGGKVLACGPSNLSVDNILERLLAFPGIVNPTRIGHPARVMAQLSKYTMDHKSKNGDDANIIKKADRDEEKRKINNSIRDLRKDLKAREMVLIETIIKNSNVILSTNTGAADFSLRGKDDFDWVIIDEAAQSLEASCWIPMQKGKRLLLAGDHQQLPPTIHSDKASKDGLSITLFERLIKSHGDNIARLLSVQYRMNSAIMDWSSKEFYNSKMTADPSVANHTLIELSKTKRQAVTTTCPLMMIDTSGCAMEESADDESESKFNIGETKVVLRCIEKLVRYGMDQAAIGVITPYNGQVKALKALVQPQFPDVEIGTVDGFQGREKEVVIISMVRSNEPPHKVGFLAEDRRTNVAVTRARRQVLVVCDTTTISSYPFLKRMVEYFRKNGEIRSALEYVEDHQSSDEEVWIKDKEEDVVSSESQDKTAGGKQRMSIAELRKEKKKQKKAQTKDIDPATRKEENRLKEIAALKIIIDQFLKSSSLKHTFPSSLNPYQRMLVHELAETYKLNHETPKKPTPAPSKKPALTTPSGGQRLGSATPAKPAGSKKAAKPKSGDELLDMFNKIELAPMYVD
eukprot:gene18869-22570_t